MEKKEEKKQMPELTLAQKIQLNNQNFKEKARDKALGRYLILQQVKKIFGIKTLLLLLLPGLMFSQSSKKVRGYTKKDGTHVQSYHRTKADATTKNNYSHKGNTNPYTGKKGSKK